VFPPLALYVYRRLSIYPYPYVYPYLYMHTVPPPEESQSPESTQRFMYTRVNPFMCSAASLYIYPYRSFFFFISVALRDVPGAKLRPESTQRFMHSAASLYISLSIFFFSSQLHCETFPGRNSSPKGQKNNSVPHASTHIYYRGNHH